MEKTDLYLGIMDNAKLDSLHKTAIVKIDSLETLLSNHLVSESYFSDILSHQWTLLSIQTSIFIFIILAMISIAGYFSWRTLRNYVSRLKKLEDYFENIPELFDRLNASENRSTRALYQSETDQKWKVIWHIRYIKWFVGNLNNSKDGKIWEGLILRCKKLAQEYNELKLNKPKYDEFLIFENKEGLKSTLIELISLDQKDITQIASEILIDLQKNK